MTASLPPHGGGPPLLGWSWDIPVKSSAFDGIRWTDEPLEIVGRWDGETFSALAYRQSSVVPAALEGATPISNPTPDCAAATADRLTSNLVERWQQLSTSGGDPLIISAEPLRSGGYCGALIIAFAPNDDLDSLVEDFEDAAALVSYRLVEMLAPPSLPPYEALPGSELG